MTKDNAVPPELEQLVEKRDSSERREKKIHVARERRTGKDRRAETDAKKKP